MAKLFARGALPLTPRLRSLPVVAAFGWLVATSSGCGAVATLAAVVLTSGGSSSGGGGGVAPPSNAIGPAGGTLVSGAVEITVPPGAVSESLVFTVGNGSEVASGEFVAVGAARLLGPAGTQFSSPVTVKLPYDPSQIPAGFGPGDVLVLKRDGAGAILELSVLALDPAARTLTVQTSSFSTLQPCVKAGVDAGRSTVDAAPTNLVAGGATSVVTVTVLNPAGRPIPNRDVILEASGSGNTIVQPPPTDHAGRTQGTLASSVPETKTLTVRVGPAELDQKPQVTFVAPTPPPPAPPAPTGLTATARASNLVELTWTDTALDETGFQLERGPAGSGVFVAVATPPANATSFFDATVAPLTSYDYRIVAINLGGESPPSNVASATTPALPPPPPAPTGLTATAQGSNLVELTWVDTALDETGFRLERRPGAFGTFVPVATPVANSTSFSDATVVPLTLYNYRIVAINPGGESPPSNVASTTTPAPPPPPPPIATSAVRATALSPFAVSLSWTENAAQETNLRVDRRRGSGPFLPVATLPANTAAHVDRTPLPETTYDYRVVALNAGGVALPLEVARVTTPPARPAKNADFEAALPRAWTRFGPPASYTFDLAQFDVSGGGVPSAAARFRGAGRSERVGVLQRITTGAGTLTVQLPIAAFSSSNNSAGGALSLLLDGKHLDYHDFGRVGANQTERALLAATLPVAAGDHELRVSGYTPWQYLDDVALGGAALAPPSPPVGLMATPGPGSVDLTWTDTASNESGFRVERSPLGLATFAEITRVGPNTTAFSDGAIPPGAAYDYRVLATNVGGDSAPSNTASTPAPPVPAPPAALTADVAGAALVRLSWTDVATDEQGYRVERSLAGQASYAFVGAVPANANTFSDPRALSLVAYDYRVSAVNAGGASPPAAVSATPGNPATAPGAPSNLSTQALGPNLVELTWSNAVPNSAGCRVERGPSGTGTFTPIASLSPGATAFSDWSVTPGSAYAYRVVNLNSGGDSAFSDVASSSVPAYGSPRPPTHLHASPRGPFAVLLGWTDSAANETGYRVERSPAGAGTFVEVNLLSAEATSYLDLTTIPGTSYDYRVSATNGSSPPTNLARVSTPPAAPPRDGDFELVDLRNWTPFGPAGYFVNVVRYDVSGGGTESWAARFSDTGFSNLVGLLQSVTLTAGNLTLTVDAAASSTGNNGAGGVVSLLFDGAVVDTHDFGGISANTVERVQLSATVAGVTAGLHEVRLQVQRGGASSSSTPWQYFDDLLLSGTAVPAPPLAPSLLSATTAGPTTVDLAWLDNALTETGYRIERSEAGASTFAQIALAPANSIFFSDTTAVANQAYDYRVFATNGGGDSSSATASTSVPVAPTLPGTLTAVALNPSQIDLTWTDTSSNELGFRIERSLEAQDDFAEVGRVAANATAFSDTLAGESTRYSYRVVAYNGGGESPPSAQATATTPASLPAAPFGLNAFPPPASGVRVNWGDAANNETEYRVERRLTGVGAFATVITLPADSRTWTDTTVQAATTYDYRVMAVNAAGSSAPSNVVTVASP